MSIPLPNLDDRRWSDLVDEARSTIPVYAPGWTDHNASDPGITLLELFAWIAEQDIYRLNRISEAARRKFLALIGEEARPPQAAHTILAFRPKHAGVGLRIPSTIEFKSSGKVFRTRYPLQLSGLAIAGVQTSDGSHFQDLGAGVRDGVFLPFGSDPKPGAALYLGFDAPLPRCLVSLYVRPAHPRALTWVSIVTEERERLRECRPPTTCGYAATRPLLAGTSRRFPHHSAVVAWETLGAGGAWVPAAVKDATRSLTLAGHVRISARNRMAPAAVGRVAAPHYWVRCRLVSGAFDEPPALSAIWCDAVEAEQSVQAPAFAPPPDSPAPELIRIATGDGSPVQRFRLQPAPLVRAAVGIFSREQGTWRPWQRRADLSASGPADLHYAVDATSGDVVFGDGRRGRVPPPGAELYAAWRSTLASAGMIPADQEFQVLDSPHNRRRTDVQKIADTVERVVNPAAAWGGADEETLGAALARAAKERESAARAVTLADYEALARATPGTRLARVAALANVCPGLECYRALGMVTVVILPNDGSRKPFPSAGLRQAVLRHLRRRRPIGTRVEVIGPEYLEISVRCSVRPLAGQNPDRLRDEARAALDRFFGPLEGGDLGTGWEFGRDVYRSEVMAVLDGVPGVDHVVSLDLAAAKCGPQCGDICVKPGMLTVSGAHQIEVL